MSPTPMVKAHKDPCSEETCPQELCKRVRENPEVEFITQNCKTYEIPPESNYEVMVAMASGDRKRRLLACFKSLEELDGKGEFALSHTQKVMLAGAMEVRL